MATKRKPAPKPHAEDDPAQLSFEQAVSELEGIIEKIETGEIGLQESLDAFKRGDALIRRCRATLEASEQEIRKLTADALDEEDEA